ncbi:MAG: hypothetical protein O7C98_16235, partial [Planctomycetota bacterium]|nr:hypothetical protein [Planctomycetota bacterium]
GRFELQRSDTGDLSADVNAGSDNNKLDFTLRAEQTQRGKLLLTGSAFADLDYLTRQLEPLRLPRGLGYYVGELVLHEFTLSRTAQDPWSFELDGELRDFAVRKRPGGKRLLVPQSDVRLEGSWDPALQRCELRGALGELKAEDFVAHFRAGELQELVGKLSGRSRLLPRFLKAFRQRLEMPRIKEAEGELELDLGFSTKAGSVELDGSATLHGARLVLDVPAPWNERMVQDRLSFDGQATLSEGTWSGGGTLTGDHFTLGVRKLRRDPDGNLQAVLEGTVRDLAAVRGQGLLAFLRDDHEIGGTLTLEELKVERKDAGWTADGTLRSEGLTARIRGDGLAQDPLVVELHAAGSGRRWKLDGTSVRSAALNLEAVIDTGSVLLPGPHGRGAFEATGTVDVDAAALVARIRSRALPKVRGHLHYEGLYEHGEQSTLKGGLDVTGLVLPVAGRTLTSRQAHADIVATLLADGDRLVIDDLSVQVEEGRLDLNGEVSGLRHERKPAFVMLNFKAEGEFGRIGERLGGLNWEGRVTTAGRLSGPLNLADALDLAEGRYRINGTAKAVRLTAPETKTELHNATVRYLLSFEKRGPDITDIDGSVTTNAARASTGGRSAEKLELVYTVLGELRGQRDEETLDEKTLDVETQLTARTVTIDGMHFEHVRARLEDRVSSVPLRDLRRVGGVGNASFRTVKAKATGQWTDGRIEFRGQNLKFDVTSLKVRYADGIVTGTGEVDLSRERPAWEADVRLDDLRVTPRLANVLSYVVPFFRAPLGGDGAGTKGTLSGPIFVSAVGFGSQDLIETLEGHGTLYLRNVVVGDSTLLGAMAPFLRRAQRKELMRFDDLGVQFRIEGGVVRPEPFIIRGRPLDLRVSGTVRLDGTVDFAVRPIEPRSGITLPTTLKVEGSLDKPKLRATLRSPFD